MFFQDEFFAVTNTRSISYGCKKIHGEIGERKLLKSQGRIAKFQIIGIWIWYCPNSLARYFSFPAATGIFFFFSFSPAARNYTRSTGKFSFRAAGQKMARIRTRKENKNVTRARWNLLDVRAVVARYRCVERIRKDRPRVIARVYIISASYDRADGCWNESSLRHESVFANWDSEFFIWLSIKGLIQTIRVILN